VHAAASFGSVNAIKLFTYLNLDLNATTNDAVTPLMLAASAGHQHALRLLLNGGGNVSMIDRAGLQPLHYAAGHSDYQLLHSF
jgi:ankyrin repeat protein